jgi:hypothetical protein
MRLDRLNALTAIISLGAWEYESELRARCPNERTP